MNREPDFIYEDHWVIDAPNLWDWVQQNALHIEYCSNACIHRVCMPLPDGA